MLYIVQYMDSDSTRPDVLYAGSDAILASQEVRKVVESWGDVSYARTNPLGEVEIGSSEAMLYNPFEDITYRVWTDEYNYIPAPSVCPGENCTRFGTDKCLNCIRNDGDCYDWCSE